MPIKRRNTAWIALVVFLCAGQTTGQSPAADLLDSISGALPDAWLNLNPASGVSDALSTLIPNRDGQVLGLLENIPAQVSDLSLANLGLGNIEGGNLLGVLGVDNMDDLFTGEVADSLNEITGFTGVEVLGDLLKGKKERVRAALGFEEVCTDAGVLVGEKVPAGCTGPTLSFIVDGGVCVVEETTGEVVCSQPAIVLAQTPTTCNLKYEEGCTVVGQTCLEHRNFGEKVVKSRKKDPKTIEVNKRSSPITFPDLGDLPFDLEATLVDVLDDIID